MARTKDWQGSGGTAIFYERPAVAPLDEANQRWAELVRPAEWPPPAVKESYHLVVVGGGTAGLVAASLAASLGARVALVERRFLGGDCLSFGCVPSKSLIASARGVKAARSLAPLDDVRLDRAFEDAMSRLRQARADLAPVDSAERFRSLGVDVFFGQGRFVAGDTLEVASLHGAKRLRFRRALIASGGGPKIPAIAGLDEVECLTNESIFSLTERPGRLAVIGGGPIGCELAQAFARFGSRVWLFQSAPRLLMREAAEASEIVARALRQDRVECHLATEVEEVGAADDSIRLAYRQVGGAPQVIEVDRILVASGRRPNVEGLGLEAAGVEYDARGVHVDDFLATSNRRIFAAGDIASGPQFTHLADAHARLVVRNALFRGRQSVSRLVLPRCTYTDPEVGQVGLDVDAAELDEAFDLTTVELAEVDRARLEGRTEGFLRVVTRKGSDLLVGATIVTPHAGELLGALTLAIRHGIGLKALSSTIFPYPTYAEMLRKAGDAHQRRRLTPGLRRWLAAWIRFSLR